MNKDFKWGKKVKECWYGVCCNCGGIGTDPCHIFPRGILETRLIIKNGLWMCRKCHRKFDDDMNEEEKKRFAIRFIGEYTYNELEKIANRKRENEGEFEEVE